MQTTVDIPDDLYRQAKAQAEARGINLRDLLEDALRQALKDIQTVGMGARRIPPPLIENNATGTLTSDDVYRAENESFEKEDLLYGGDV